jgi:allophycocyanin beta subunit
MQDAITSVINSSDVQGKYLDNAALEKLKGYFQTGELRVRAGTTISANAAAIVKKQWQSHYCTLTSHVRVETCIPLAAMLLAFVIWITICAYSTYAMLAGDPPSWMSVCSTA